MLPYSKIVGEGKRAIEGTLVFDGDAAQAGYALNAMCYSFNHAENREAFARDEDAYMDRFDLTEEQTHRRPQPRCAGHAGCRGQRLLPRQAGGYPWP